MYFGFQPIFARHAGPRSGIQPLGIPFGRCQIKTWNNASGTRGQA